MKYLHLLIFTLFSLTLKAQSINFNFTNGTNTSYNVSDIKKITFNGDIMVLNLSDGSTYSWNVNTIGDYNYNNVVIIKDINKVSVTIFPNPVIQNLNIRFQSTEQNIIVILVDMNGKQILENSFNNQDEVSIDVSTLENGNYVCLIKLSKITISRKFIKQ